jgi:hypothetical protein
VTPLYPAAARPLDPAAMRDPPAIYRGAPFWSWNCRLERDRLRRQIAAFAAMGMGGFHMHARSGLDTPYLGDEFLALVADCVAEAKRLGIRAWLYDEDRWPSGMAGGAVCADPALRARCLRLSPSSASPDGRPPVARWQVELDAAGCLAGYRRLAADESATAGTTWHAFLEEAEPLPWFGRVHYLDTLNPAAVDRFIDLTHERYRQVVGEAFGETIPAIFTDEPMVFEKQCLGDPTARCDLRLPWTGDLAASWRAAYGDDPFDRLPELLWELPDGRASRTRWQYHDHVAGRFAAAYGGRIGAWCDRHGLAATGHFIEEDWLGSQTALIGDVMRCYPAFRIPGIDLLCDARHPATAKQAQSIKHQYAREAMLSELYGVTDWDFPFAGHKRQGDWQAALGVTIRVHHLAWAPWRCDLGPVAPGAHELAITVHGHRRNAFGAVHCCDPRWTWWGPNAWRSEGDAWTDGYVLRPGGLLAEARLEVAD